MRISAPCTCPGIQPSINHIEVHYHFIKERVLPRDIKFSYINTNDKVSNIFIKSWEVRSSTNFELFFRVHELALSLRGNAKLNKI